jgi:hypothetical protein
MQSLLGLLLRVCVHGPVGHQGLQAVGAVTCPLVRVVGGKLRCRVWEDAQHQGAVALPQGEDALLPANASTWAHWAQNSVQDLVLVGCRAYHGQLVQIVVCA